MEKLPLGTIENLTIPNHFNHTAEGLALGGLFLVVCGGVELVKRFSEKPFVDSLEPAKESTVAMHITDTDSAMELRNRRVQRNIYKERAGFAAFAVFGLGLIGQLAGPVSNEVRSHGTTEVVIDAALAQDASDTIDHGTRLQDSILGAARADAKLSVPFSFIIDSPLSPQAAKIPGSDKNTASVTQLLNNTVSNLQSRNGETIDVAAEQGVAQALANGGGNVILITSAFLGNGDTDPSQAEEQNLKSSVANLPSSYNKAVKTEAVIVGEGPQLVALGGKGNTSSTTIASPIDAQSFEDDLGSANVSQAYSAQQIEQKIEKIVNASQIQQKNKISDLPIAISLLGATIGGLFAAERRGNGVFRNIKFSRALAKRRKEQKQ